MTKGKIFAGTVLGAVAGFVAGILTAPKSGKETRKDVKDAGVRAKNVAVAEAAKLKKTATTEAGKAKEVVEDVVEDVSERADALRRRSIQAIEGAKRGFSEDPKTSRKK